MLLRRTILLRVPLLTLSLCAQTSQKPLVVVLIGTPLSGKSTQAEYLQQKYKIPVISTESLIEESDKQISKRGNRRRLKRTDDRINALLRERLASVDISRGFGLDGYPATRSQADYLRKLVKEFSLPEPIIIQVHIPDDVARERAAKRGGPDDTPDLIEDRLTRYHDEMEMIREYYPRANIWTIDGTRTIQGVSATIRLLIEDRL